MNLVYKKINRYSFFLKSAKSIKKNLSGQLINGIFGIKSLSTSFVTFKQINNLRVLISRKLKSVTGLFYKIYIRIFFTRGLTKKPSLTRMGKGSGPIKIWVGLVHRGSIFVEVRTKNSLFYAIRVSLNCLNIRVLPFKSKFIFRL